MTNQELIEVLRKLKPGLRVVADDGDGGLVPIDGATVASIGKFDNLPDGEYIILRPLQDWILMDRPD